MKLKDLMLTVLRKTHGDGMATENLDHIADLLVQTVAKDFASSASPAHSLNALARMCHQANEKWWRDPATGERLKDRNVGELLMLTVSELSEALEGHRRNLMDDKLPHRKMFDVEIVDALHRLLDIAGAPEMGVENVGETFVEKMEYNRTREDHSNAARLATNGKKY